VGPTQGTRMPQFLGTFVIVASCLLVTQAQDNTTLASADVQTTVVTDPSVNASSIQDTQQENTNATTVPQGAVQENLNLDNTTSEDTTVNTPLDTNTTSNVEASDTSDMKTTKAEAVPQATTEVGTTEQVENSNTEAANTSATNITVFDEKEDVMVSGNNDTNTNSTTNAGNATAMVEETKAETTLNPPVETSEVVTETGDPLATMVAEHHDMLMEEEAGMLDLQTQLYILSATFGGVIFLLIILVLVLALSVARIKEQLHQRLREERTSRRSGGSTTYGYENGGFHGPANGHAVNERSVDVEPDLEQLGYTQYRGGARESAYKVSDPGNGGNEIPMGELRAQSGNPLMKYEEGVVPLGERDGEPSDSYNYR